MNTYFNISNELKTYFSTNSIFKILLPIGMVIMFVGLGVLFLADVLGINFGGFFVSLAFWAFILGLILTYANMQQQFLYIGLFAYAAINLIEFLKYLLNKYSIFGWGYIFYILVFGGLGYLVFRHSVSGNNQSGYNG